MELNKEELDSIVGGAVKTGVLISIGALITFLIGVVDGYLRPFKCN